VRTILICHEGAKLNRDGLARWLASFSDLVGIIVLRETSGQVWRRISREVERIGLVRFCDVIAMRVYYNLFIASRDRRWQMETLDRLKAAYPDVPSNTQILVTDSPNSAEAKQFIQVLYPDLMIARCKRILKEDVFSIPTRGTFVMHPGICPEYRNAHGCFWALANGDFSNVGMTLLRIDRGVDTGPVYGYYTYPYDELSESHTTIMWRVVLENLDSLRTKFEEIYRGSAGTIDISGRASAVWGQPWLSQYLRWKRRAKRRCVRESDRS
jgi:hypothetical protein